MRAGVVLAIGIVGRGQVEERRQDQRSTRGAGCAKRGIGEHGVRKPDGQDGVIIAPHPVNARNDRHVRSRPATRRPVRRVTQEPAEIPLQGQVPDREPPHGRSVDDRDAGLVDPAAAAVSEVPEIVCVAGEHIRGVPRRDKPPDHRAAIVLRAANARVVTMGKPGDPHRNLLVYSLTLKAFRKQSRAAPVCPTFSSARLAAGSRKAGSDPAAAIGRGGGRVQVVFQDAGHVAAEGHGALGVGGSGPRIPTTDNPSRAHRAPSGRDSGACRLCTNASCSRSGGTVTWQRAGVAQARTGNGQESADVIRGREVDDPRRAAASLTRCTLNRLESVLWCSTSVTRPVNARFRGARFCAGVDGPVLSVDEILETRKRRLSLQPGEEWRKIRDARKRLGRICPRTASTANEVLRRASGSRKRSRRN